jgi:DNA-binding transcriptional MerR regulator
VRAGLTIGDFSRITHLSVKTLRRYHEAGLLEPDQVDPSSGYRYYALTQIPTAQVIRHFRALGMPVREVADVLATTDVEARSALIAAHLDRLQTQLDQTRAAVTSLRRLLAPTPTPVDIEQRSTRALTTAAIRVTVDLSAVLTWYSAGMTEINNAIDAAGLTRTGAPGGIYAHDLFTAERGEAVIYVPVTDPPTDGRVRPFVVPAQELAIVVHSGPHDDIDISYAALGRYVTENEIAVEGPVHERYLVGPSDTDESRDWRTEIGWPIFRTSLG